MIIMGDRLLEGEGWKIDVYKRQGAVLSNQSAINQNAANKNLMGHTATGKSTMDSDTIRSEKTTPVSYTHLDVYKRQVLWDVQWQGNCPGTA